MDSGASFISTYMETSNQLYAPAALPRGKLPVLNKWQAGSAPEPLWARWCRGKPPFRRGSNLNSPVDEPVVVLILTKLLRLDKYLNTTNLLCSSLLVTMTILITNAETYQFLQSITYVLLSPQAHSQNFLVGGGSHCHEERVSPMTSSLKMHSRITAC